MIVDAYVKATTGVKPVPEGYTAFKHEGKRYAYKSLGDGTWTSECASMDLMKVLRNHFITFDMMKEGDVWPDSNCFDAWTNDVNLVGDNHVILGSNGSTYDNNNYITYARFAVSTL